jgi:HlyD family secretion protein
VKKLLVLLVLIGAILVGVAYWMNYSTRSNGEGQFTTASVERGGLAEVVNATGILQPEEITAVGSPLSGEVVEICDAADFNKFVKKGQELLKLDDRMAKLKQSHAEVGVELAEADVTRAQASLNAAQVAQTDAAERFNKNLLKKPELDQAKTALAVAEAGLDAAKVRVKEAQEALKLANLGVELTVVRAPTSGWIIDKKVIRGQLIAPPVCAQLFTIASDLKWLHLNAQVPEGDSSRVRPGLKATFTVYAYTDADDTFQGTVEQVRPMATNVQGAVFYSTIIKVANREIIQSNGVQTWMLKPGMTANVDIQRRRHDDTWKMPNAALTFPLDEHYQTPEAKAKLEKWQSQKSGPDWVHVWVLRNKKPWPLFVRIGGKNAAGDTGIKDGQFTEILEWEPEFEPKADPKTPATFPQVIIAAPPVTKPGIFDKPSLKLS